MTRSAPRPEPADEWVTVAVAALLAKRDVNTIYDWIKDERMVSEFRDGKRVVLKRAALRLGQEVTRGRPKSPPN